MPKNKDYYQKIIKKIQEDESSTTIKKWNESVIPKLILLLPTILYLLTFLRINNDKSILDLFNFLLVAFILVLFGVVLNFLLTKK